MKVTSINSNNSHLNINNRSNNNNNPSFNGVTEGLINFWQFVDNGGRALQFTVEDMTGTNFPRSIKGLLAGRKYTGKFNWLAFAQEAIREFLTGPTMCIVPWVVISLAKKIGGESANIETKNMRNLSYLLSEKTQVAQGQELSDAFYQTVVKDMLDKSTQKDVNEETVNSMVDLFKKLSSTTDKKEKGKVLSEIQDLFERTVKHLKDDYHNTSFLTAKHSVSSDAAKIGETNIQNYASYTTAYIKDYTKKFGQIIDKDKIKNFSTSKQAYRLVTTIGGMMILTGVLMCQIPKLYTKVSGMVNPNASAIYDEAKKNKRSLKTGGAK